MEKIILSAVGVVALLPIGAIIWMSRSVPIISFSFFLMATGIVSYIIFVWTRREDSIFFEKEEQ